MGKRGFNSVAFYIVIPVIILGILSTISVYISLTALGSVNNASKKIYGKQLGGAFKDDDTADFDFFSYQT